jgi:Tfp pilus assembly protein PilO
MSEHFPDLTGWQLAVRVVFACAVTLAVIAGAYFSIRWLAGLRPYP